MLKLVTCKRREGERDRDKWTVALILGFSIFLMCINLLIFLLPREPKVSLEYVGLFRLLLSLSNKHLGRHPESAF